MRSARAYSFIALVSFGVMVAALTGAVSSWSASAVVPNATLSIDPVTQSVNAGSQFTVAVKQNAVVESGGSQMDIVFDQTKLQIATCPAFPAACPAVARGAALTGASLLAGVAPQHMVDAINEANTTGRLRNLAGYFNPGAGTVPSGDVTLFVVTMSAKADASGSSGIALENVGVLALDGLAVANVVAIPGTVVVVNPNVQEATSTPTASASATPTASATATPTGTLTPSTSTSTSTSTSAPTRTATATSTSTPTPTTTGTQTTTATPTPTSTKTPQPTKTPVTLTPTSTPFRGSGSIVVVPASVAVSPNTDFTININQNANFTTLGTFMNIEFDKNLLQIVSVERAPAFTRAGSSILIGIVKCAVDDPQCAKGGKQQTGGEAIAEANGTGVLMNVSVSYAPNTSWVDPGENSFLILKLKSTATEGTSKITLDHVIPAAAGDFGGGDDGPQMLDLDGKPTKITSANGEVKVAAGSAPPVAPTPAVAAASTPVSVSGTPRAAGGNTSTTLGASKPGGVSPGTASPTGLPRTGEGAEADGRMLLLALIAAMCMLGSGGLAVAQYVRQRRGW